MPSDEVPATTADELLADEVADIAVADPEEAARLVAAVSADRTFPSQPVQPTPGQAPGRPNLDQGLPGAIAAVLLLQVVAASRFKRLLLALVGSALVAGLVSRTQKP